MLDFDFFLMGVYSEAWQLFSEFAKTSHSNRSHIAFLLAVDYALNPPLPPFTIPGVLRVGFRYLQPGWRFIFAVKAIKSLELNRPLHFDEPDELKEFIQEISHHFEHNGLVDSPSLVLGGLPKAYPEVLKKSLFKEIIDSTVTSSLSSVASIRHALLITRTLRTLDIRKECQEFIPYPGLVYTRDRKEFHQYYDLIAPPLIQISNTIGSRDHQLDEGEVGYYSQLSLASQFLRDIVLLDYPSLILRLKSRGETLGIENANKTIVDALRFLIAGTPLLKEIESDLILK